MNVLSAFAFILFGLIVGWYLPQPEWVKKLIATIKREWNELRAKRKKETAVEAVKEAGVAMAAAGEDKVVTTTEPTKNP